MSRLGLSGRLLGVVDSVVLLLQLGLPLGVLGLCDGLDLEKLGAVGPADGGPSGLGFRPGVAPALQSAFEVSVGNEVGHGVWLSWPQA